MQFTKTTFKNGLRLITIPMKSNSTVTVLVLVEAGSKYETKDINGLSHFLEHMCFKGTVKRPSAFSITSELDGIGAQSNAFTSTEYTGYYAKAHYKKLPEVIDIVSDVYLHSTFPEGEMTKEKGVVIEEMNMYEDLPHRKVQEVFEELLYGDQPAGWPIIGNKKTVEAITRDALLSYRQNQYVAKSTIVVVSGNFAEKQTIKHIEKVFQGISMGLKKGKLAVVEKQSKPAVKVSYRKTDQTHLVIGFRAYPVKDKRNYAASVLATILGRGFSSRLFVKMREELGICYYVRAMLDSATDHGAFSVSAGVGNGRTKEAVEAILLELKKIKTHGVQKDELKKAKDFMIGNMALDLESSDDFANYYGAQEINREKLMRPEEQVKKVQAVTAAQIQAIAKELFQNKSLNMALIGPFKEGKEFLPLLSI